MRNDLPNAVLEAPNFAIIFALLSRAPLISQVPLQINFGAMRGDSLARRLLDEFLEFMLGLSAAAEILGSSDIPCYISDKFYRAMHCSRAVDSVSRSNAPTKSQIEQITAFCSQPIEIKDEAPGRRILNRFPY